MMKQKEYNIGLHELECSKSKQVCFKSNLTEFEVYSLIKLEGYKLYQFIDNDFLYNMDIHELDENNISYTLLNREKKMWFGLGSKTISDVLIHPSDDYFYPYSFGYYFYLFTKKKIRPLDFEKWIKESFPERFADFDELSAFGSGKGLQLLNEEDYLLVTDHDYHKDFGITASAEVMFKLVNKLNKEFKVEPFKKIKNEAPHDTSF